MPSLLDIEPLEALQDVCWEHGVVIEAFGGVVTRAAMRWEFDDRPVAVRRLPDLFELTPFTADVDLTHSGSARQTNSIVHSILRAVPAAEAFRWQVKSERERSPERIALRCSNVIPARRMSLSTVRGSDFFDPYQGRADIVDRNFRYLNNRAYKASPLYLAGRDLEFFSAILYAQTLLEANLSAEAILGQSGYKEAQKVLIDASESSETLVALEKSSYLRSRLEYLLKNIAAASNNAVQWQAIVDMGVGQLADLLNRNANGVLFSRETLIQLPTKVFFSAASLRSGHMRFSELAEPMGLVTYSADLVQERVFDHAARFSEKSIPLVDFADDAPVVYERPQEGEPTEMTVHLADRMSVALAVGPLSPESGKSPSSRLAGVGFEFVHLHIPLVGNEAIELAATLNQQQDGEKNLSGVLAIRSEWADAIHSEGWTFFAIPTLVSIGRWDKGILRLKIRINCYQILDAAPPSAGALSEPLRPSTAPYRKLSGSAPKVSVRLILLSVT